MFVHLHNHTEYSLLDGASRIEGLVQKAAEQGMPAVAITDHGSMYGVIEFYKKAKEKGIKPIIGCEVYVAPRSRFYKEAGKDGSMHHLVLLAKNQEGYRNLIRLVSMAYLEGFYYKPRVDKEILEANSSGLIVLSACLAGEVQDLLLKGEKEEARRVALWYRDIFGTDNYYLELQNQGLPQQEELNHMLLELSQETNIPLVATNDVHYLEEEDAGAHDVLLCIQTGKNVEEENRLKFEGSSFYFKDYQQMREAFREFPEEVFSNSVKIAEQVELDFEFNRLYLPPYEIPEPYHDAEEYLEALCRRGLQERYAQITAETEERLLYELSVINQMGYAGYFLIVWDFVRFARDQGIPVGPGRGSAAGSLVAYALYITDVDPLRYGLIFERFLNPERVSMPDIDIDFCYERRDEVIRYVVDKYGEDKVAQIITFGTMAARLAVRDVGRALNFPYGEVDRIAKMIPFELGMSINKALELNKELKALYHSDKRYSHLLDTSRKVEGLPRHASTHAAGVVIAGGPLTELVPLQKTSDGAMVTQFPMNVLEELGLLKMDFLGLRTLTIMAEAVHQANKECSAKDVISIDSIPLYDKQTFALLSSGETAGVFQLESSGMRGVLKELKPSRLEDIIAVVALYRPGPMEQIPVFIESKHGKRAINYPHPDLEPVLKETYGVIVYQEQIIEVAARMAGFTRGQGDLLRRAIGKKKMQILDEQRQIFVQGVEDKGYPRKLGEELYELILKFANYGFNKSHAAAYALVAYQTAFLKANYPLEFMAALLTGNMSNSDKVALYIADCHRQGIKIHPPDVNESETNFTVTKDKHIRFGLAAVKNVGRGAIDTIIKTREKEGKFTSLYDFCNKVDLRTCNRKVIESLIKGGAFDSLGGLRAQYLSILEKALACGHQVQKDKAGGQISMFSYMEEAGGVEAPDDELPRIKEFSFKEKLLLEKEMVGVYVSGHPLDQYREILDNLNGVVANAELTDLGEGRQVSIAGLINSYKVVYTKKGLPMCFMTVEDLTGEREVVVFNDLYERYQEELQVDRVVIVGGKVTIKDETEIKIIAVEMTFLPLEPKQLIIKVGEDKPLGEMVALKDTLTSFQGGIPVYLYFENSGKLLLTGKVCWVREDNNLFNKIEKIMGNNSIKLQEQQAASAF